MKLLFIIDHLGIGGAQKQLVNLAIGLRSQGHEVKIFIYHPQYKYYVNKLSENDIEIITYGKRGRFDPFVISAIRKEIKLGNYDGTLSFLDTPNLYSEIASIDIKNIPVIVSIRSSYPFGKIRYKRYFQEQFHRLASAVTVNTIFQKYQMEAVHPWVKGKLITIYNGIDLEDFKPIKGYLTPYHKNQKINRLLVLANTSKLKNMYGLVKSLVFYKEIYGEPPLVHWAGRKSKYKDDEKDFIKSHKLVLNYGLEEKFKYIGEQNDIPKLINTYDAIVLPSFYEGLPNAICEGMACGKPVIASNVCEIPHLLQDGIRGFLFNPYDEKDIAKAIHKFVVLGTDKKVNMGRNARIFSEENFSLNRYVAEYESLFNRMIKK